MGQARAGHWGVEVTQGPHGLRGQYRDTDTQKDGNCVVRKVLEGGVGSWVPGPGRGGIRSAPRTGALGRVPRKCSSSCQSGHELLDVPGLCIFVTWRLPCTN